MAFRRGAKVELDGEDGGGRQGRQEEEGELHLVVARLVRIVFLIGKTERSQPLISGRLLTRQYFPIRPQSRLSAGGDSRVGDQKFTKYVALPLSLSLTVS